MRRLCRKKWCDSPSSGCPCCGCVLGSDDAQLFQCQHPKVHLTPPGMQGQACPHVHDAVVSMRRQAPGRRAAAGIPQGQARDAAGPGSAHRGRKGAWRAGEPRHKPAVRSPRGRQRHAHVSGHRLPALGLQCSFTVRESLPAGDQTACWYLQCTTSAAGSCPLPNLFSFPCSKLRVCVVHIVSPKHAFNQCSPSEAP